MIHLSCCISGTLTVEEVYKDRDQFASLVREVAAPDVGRMGIEILSFTIKDVYDNVTYLASLGEYSLNKKKMKPRLRDRKQWLPITSDEILRNLVSTFLSSVFYPDAARLSHV